MYVFRRATIILITLFTVRMQRIFITARRMFMHRFFTATIFRAVRMFRRVTASGFYDIVIRYAATFVTIPASFYINIVISRTPAGRSVNLPFFRIIRRAARFTALQRPDVIPTGSAMRMFLQTATRNAVYVFRNTAN
jgi:hypothetical protein